MTVAFSAPDLDPFAEQLGRVGQALGDFTGPSREAAAVALGDVRAPVRSGALAATVEAVPTALGFTLTAGGPRAPYGPIVHARDPFLSEAITSSEQEVLDAYAEHLDTTLDTLTT